MLETEEVDDDYFTPISNTSLANIFGKKSENEQMAGNQTLKYTPPPKVKSEDSKLTHCIFACALLGYQWLNNVYTSRGKVGFAILKIVKSGLHNIVLYDSNKITLSCTLISSCLEITVQGNYITYYDDAQKHWSLYATELEISKIGDTLKTLGISIKHSTCEDKVLPNPQNLEYETSKLDLIKTEKESDTDSSVNRKTKASILSRMASMGQAILPPNTLSKEITSDSSDTNEGNNHHVVVRHKPVKSLVKRVHPEKSTLDLQIGSHHRSTTNKTETPDNIQLYTPTTSQLLPTNSNLIANTSSSYGNDLNLLMTEQRINNSELRINFNRMSDKIDLILDKMKESSFSDKKSSTTNIQDDLAHKLLVEYENKIKMYEEIIKSKESKINLTEVNTSQTEQYKLLKNEILELQFCNEAKDKEISNLKQEIQHLTSKLNNLIEMKTKNDNDMLQDMKVLEEALMTRNEELESIRTQSEKEAPNLLENNDELKSTVKNIMNDTYRAIIANFDSNETYTSESIKSTIAKVIKQITIESLHGL